jgi:dTDP-4-dehydrorhamnose reductase
VDPGTFDVLSTDVDTLDVTDRTAIGSAFEAFRPDLVLHGGAYTAVEACESDPDTAFAVNALGTRHIAEASVRCGAHLVYVSTDYVFDGASLRPYVEWDETGPTSVYGRSKLGGEHEVHQIAGADATVVRTAWVSGAHGANMVKTVLRLGAATPDGTLRFVADQHGCPTFTADLATAIVRLALDRRPGTFHVTNQGETTWFGLAQATMAAAGFDPARVEPIATSDLDPPLIAPRPANSRLDNAALRLSGLDGRPRTAGGCADHDRLTGRPTDVRAPVEPSGASGSTQNQQSTSGHNEPIGDASTVNIVRCTAIMDRDRHTDDGDRS